MMTLLLPLLAQVSTAPPEVNCTDPQTQSAMNICAQRDYARVDVVLNTRWDEVSQEMRERDTHIDRDHDTRPGYFETFLVAQRAWISFRDAHCASEGMTARGGSMEPLLISTCKSRLALERIMQLRMLTEGLD